MKKVLAIAAVVALALGTTGTARADIVVDFDNAANWNLNGSGYQVGHVYSDQGVEFTGGPALRETAGTQDGFAKTFGTYAWRLNDDTAVSWTATLADTTSMAQASSFGFDVRRWDGTPSPSFTVAYSINGGADFIDVGTIDNTYLGDTSDWSSFNYDFGTTALADGDFIVRVSAASSPERIMIDNFSISAAAVPEPGSFAVLGLTCGLIALRRRKQRKAVAAE